MYWIILQVIVSGCALDFNHVLLFVCLFFWCVPCQRPAMLLQWTGLTGQHATCSTGGAGETHHSKAASGHKDLRTCKVRNPSEASMLDFIKVIVCYSDCIVCTLILKYMWIFLLLHLCLQQMKLLISTNRCARRAEGVLDSAKTWGGGLAPIISIHSTDDWCSI